ncbi:hypothetical protein HK100_009346 [Physocladia obscura]|uniref:Major facilitator superfamily (MFS) profile domain-containing protein n=1 Tax=Physocladia obscura TaxID=109957 RepID=A0AAD5T9C9_9FUNG|nr:hypothetical protein HK100_009346 [Physocladia obscura]
MSDKAEVVVADPETKVTWTPEEEKTLLNKIDWHVLPILTLLYLLSFLDRTNIGNAKLDGLIPALGIKDYSTLLSIFFIGYVLFEVPSNIILKRTSPPLWLPTITLGWGILTMVMGFLSDQTGIYIVRFVLGAVEAGLFPGSVFVFSLYYARKERHYRTSLFFSGAAAAGAFGGIFAYALGLLDGKGGKGGWAWIFIIEGLLTVIVSLVAYFFVPNYPHLSKRFTPREKEIIAARISDDPDAIDDEIFSWDGVWQAFRDPYVYLYGLLFHGFAFALYSLSLFMPTIIAGLGYASWQAQLMTVPPYIVAFITTMSTAHAAFVYNRRFIFIIGAALVAIVGYIIQITSPTVGGRYVSVFITASGVYAGNALLLSLPSENVSGQTKRVTALALQITLGDIGAIAGTLLYRIPLGGLANTSYNVSHGLAILWLFVGIFAASSLWFLLSRENARRDKVEAEAAETGQKIVLTPEETKKQGDRRITWRYHV